MKRVLLAFVVLAGCGGSTVPAAANAIVGGALYLGAGGCKIAGCPTNTRCNVTTERCDPIRCDKLSCGPDAVCDEDKGSCIPVSGVAAANGASSTTTTTPAVPTPLAGPNATP